MCGLLHLSIWCLWKRITTLLGFQSQLSKCKLSCRLTLYSKSIQFSVLKSNDIEKSSHVSVYSRLLYNAPEVVKSNETALACIGGPLDARLGTSEKS